MFIVKHVTKFSKYYVTVVFFIITMSIVGCEFVYPEYENDVPTWQIVNSYQTEMNNKFIEAKLDVYKSAVKYMGSIEGINGAIKDSCRKRNDVKQLVPWVFHELFLYKKMPESPTILPTLIKMYSVLENARKDFVAEQIAYRHRIELIKIEYLTRLLGVIDTITKANTIVPPKTSFDDYIDNARYVNYEWSHSMKLLNCEGKVIADNHLQSIKIAPKTEQVVKDYLDKKRNSEAGIKNKIDRDKSIDPDKKKSNSAVSNLPFQ